MMSIRGCFFGSIYGGKLWHYHLSGDTHYVFSSKLPWDVYIRVSKKYKLSAW